MVSTWEVVIVGVMIVGYCHTEGERSAGGREGGREGEGRRERRREGERGRGEKGNREGGREWERKKRKGEGERSSSKLHVHAYTVQRIANLHNSLPHM